MTIGLCAVTSEDKMCPLLCDSTHTSARICTRSDKLRRRGNGSSIMRGDGWRDTRF
jgi:hypothetical protein